MARQVLDLLVVMGPWPVVVLVALILCAFVVAPVVAFSFCQRGHRIATFTLGAMKGWSIASINLGDRIEELPPREVSDGLSPSLPVAPKESLH